MKLKNKWYDNLFNVLGATALLLASVFMAVRWPMIPQQIPRHFDLSGQADAWGSKSSLIVLLVAGWIVCLALYAIDFFPKIWNIPETTPQAQKAKVYRLCKSLLLYIRCLVAALFAFLTVQGALSQQAMPGWFLPAVFLLLFGGLAVFLAKIFSASAVFK